jgi:hypothetical protein
MMDPMIQEMQAEIQKLKIEVASTPRPSPVPALKDVTLVAGIKHSTGDSKGRTVHEFFAQIDTYAKVSNWSEDEKALIAKAKLQGIALQYVQGREVLADDACTSQISLAKNCPRSIMTLAYKTPHRREAKVLRNLRIGVDAYARELFEKSMMMQHRNK